MQLNVRALFLVLISLIVFCDCPVKTRAQSASSLAKPKWTVELKKYGWIPPKSVSNKKFFKDFILAKLEALDENTRVPFISNYASMTPNNRGKTTALQLAKWKPSSLTPRTAASYKLSCGQFRCDSLDTPSGL